MEKQTSSACVEYFSGDAEVRLVKSFDCEPWRSQRGRHEETGTRLGRRVLILVLIALLGLIIAGPTLTFFLLRNTQKEPRSSFIYKENGHEVLSEVSKLSLAAVGADSFTVTWEQPESLFDYYMVEVTVGTSGESGETQLQRAGSCASGRIIRPNHTRVTCDHLQACTNVTFRVRTHQNGPPERTSLGKVLRDIFIPGKEPDSPRDITLLGQSPSRSLLKWARPTEGSGFRGAYRVKICPSFSTCDAKADTASCATYETLVTSLQFDSTIDTEYCVVVMSTTHCGGDITYSRPATAIVRTPPFRPPDVTMARRTDVDNESFTVSWQRPDGYFDYYSMDVSDGEAGLGSSEGRHVGSCVSGTLLRPHRTKVRCEHVKSCTNASLTIYTHLNGPPERTSHGVAVQGIFISRKDLDTPRNITFTWKSSALTRVQWNPSTAPWAPMTLYSVKICFDNGICKATEQIRSCTHHETSKTWLEFESTADTEYCVLVTASARCSSNVVRSTAGSATVRTPTFVPPDVTDLTLEDIEVDSFTVTWERPEGHFDYYRVAVTDDDGGTGGNEHYHVDSCRNGTILHPEQTRLTCGHLGACTNVSFNIRTHSNGPPAHTSAGVTLGGIFIPGAAPGDFGVDAKVTSNTSVQLVVHVSQVKSCLVDDCSGECHRLGRGPYHRFTCKNHDGLTSVVALDGLEPNTEYSCKVKLTNVHKGRSMGNFEFLYLSTPK